MSGVDTAHYVSPAEINSHPTRKGIGTAAEQRTLFYERNDVAPNEYPAASEAVLGSAVQKLMRLSESTAGIEKPDKRSGSKQYDSRGGKHKAPVRGKYGVQAQQSADEEPGVPGVDAHRNEDGCGHDRRYEICIFSGSQRKNGEERRRHAEQRRGKARVAYGAYILTRIGFAAVIPVQTVGIQPERICSSELNETQYAENTDGDRRGRSLGSARRGIARDHKENRGIHTDGQNALISASTGKSVFFPGRKQSRNEREQPI